MADTSCPRQMRISGGGSDNPGKLLTLGPRGAPLALPGQMRIGGGSSDTEVKLLTVSPCGTPLASTTLAMVIPVAKRPQARRNSSLVTAARGRPCLSLDMGINSILSCG